MNELASLRERIEILEEENRQLREELGAVEAAPNFQKMKAIGMTYPAFKVLSLLVKKELVRRDFLISFLWGGDEPDLVREGLDVRIHRLRKFLKPHGIEIKTVYGIGWRLADESRKKAAALMQEISA